MKITKKNAIIAVILVAAIALMSFGFAAWTATLKATGTIKGAGSEGTIIWDVEWKSCEFVKKSDDNVTCPETADIQISTDATKNDTITFPTPIVLDKPGAFAEYKLTATNIGTVDAAFVSLTCTPTSTKDPNVADYIKTDVVDTLCDPLAVGKDCTFNLVIYVDPTYEGEVVSGVPQFTIPDDITFELELNYEQDNASSGSAPTVPEASHIA